MFKPLPNENMALEEPNEDFPYLPSGAAEVNRMIKENCDLFSDTQCNVCSAVLISDSQKLAHYQSKKHANKVWRYMCIQREEEPDVKKFKSPSSDGVFEAACSNGSSEAERYKNCHVCNMTFSSPVMAISHYQGKTHTKNLRLKSGFGPPILPIAPSARQVKKKAEEGGASVVSSGPAQDDPGRLARQVKKKAEEGGASVASSGPAQDDPGRFCPICNASFNNPLMAQQHYEGKKHQKQLKKKKLMETYGPSTTPASTVKGYPCTLCNLQLNSLEQYQAHISGSKHKNQVIKGQKKRFDPPSENQYPPE